MSAAAVEVSARLPADLVAPVDESDAGAGHNDATQGDFHWIRMQNSSHPKPPPFSWLLLCGWLTRQDPITDSFYLNRRTFALPSIGYGCGTSPWYRSAHSAQTCIGDFLISDFSIKLTKQRWHRQPFKCCFSSITCKYDSLNSHFLLCEPAGFCSMNF